MTMCQRMVLRCEDLRGSPEVFKALTSMPPETFDELVGIVEVRLEEVRRARISRPGRQRAQGGGHPFGLSLSDQVLLTLVSQRYPMPLEVLAYFFGVSRSTTARTITRILPLLRPSLDLINKRQRAHGRHGSNQPS